MTKNEYQRHYRSTPRGMAVKRAGEERYRRSENGRIKRREYGRLYFIQKKYGLTPAEYQNMVLAQNGMCAICKGRKKLAVDHNHDTGKVRGLLCSRCNSALLPIIENTPWMITAAQVYLGA